MLILEKVFTKILDFASIVIGSLLSTIHVFDVSLSPAESVVEVYSTKLLGSVREKLSQYFLFYGCCLFNVSTEALPALL